MSTTSNNSSSTNKKPSQNRLLYKHNIENPPKGYPVHGIFDARLDQNQPFDGWEDFVRRVCDKHPDRDLFVYPDHCKADENSGLTESQVDDIIEAQGERSNLDKVTIPFFDEEFVQRGEFESLDDYRNYALEEIKENYPDKEIVLAKYRIEEDPEIDQYDYKPDYLCLHYGRWITPVTQDTFEDAITSFIEDSKLPVIGYGIPEHVRTHPPRYFASSWIADQDFHWFMLGDTPVRGGSDSDSIPFVKPEESDFAEIVDLNEADFDTSKELKELDFDNYHPELEDHTPLEIAKDDDLQEKHRNHIRGVEA